MKKHQFEEILFSIDVIITLLCFIFSIKWLLWIFIIKTLFDFYFANKAAYKAAKKRKEKQNEKKN